MPLSRNSFLSSSIPNSTASASVSLLGCILADILGDLHAAKMRTAHGTEVRGLGTFLRQGLVVEVTRGLRIEGEIELIFPAKFEPRFRNRFVAVLRAGMAFGEIGGVRGDLVGDDAVFDVFLVRQTEMFFRRDVAKHRRAGPADHCFFFFPR